MFTSLTINCVVSQQDSLSPVPRVTSHTPSSGSREYHGTEGNFRNFGNRRNQCVGENVDTYVGKAGRSPIMCACTYVLR